MSKSDSLSRVITGKGQEVLHAHYLHEVITLRHEVRDYRVEKLMHRHQPGTLKDSHPTRPQHLLMADALEPVLRARLDFR